MRLIFTMLATFVTVFASAQGLTVFGYVTDSASGEPVPFASVHMEGTSSGTSTDAEGYYHLELPSKGTLVFSSIGYKSRKVPV